MEAELTRHLEVGIPLDQASVIGNLSFKELFALFSPRTCPQINQRVRVCLVRGENILMFKLDEFQIYPDVKIENHQNLIEGGFVMLIPEEGHSVFQEAGEEDLEWLHRQLQDEFSLDPFPISFKTKEYRRNEIFRKEREFQRTQESLSEPEDPSDLGQDKNNFLLDELLENVSDAVSNALRNDQTSFLEDQAEQAKKEVIQLIDYFVMDRKAELRRLKGKGKA